MQIDFLKDLVIIAVAALVAVSLLQKIGLPSVVGFIVTGLLIGPKALGFVDDIHQVEMLAEIGVVLLLFGIGLELSLDRLKALWWLILVGGALQLGLTLAIVTGLGLFFDFSLSTSIFLGFLVTVSSTAIVLQSLQARGELEAPHGRLTLGVLVFQDLCVVPMILLVPVLGGVGEGTWVDLVGQLLMALGILVAILVAAQFFVPKGLHLVALTRQRNLFVLAVFLICMGTAWVVSLAGISLALGAFLAGLVVSGSDYRTQALSDLVPFREIFTSIFFVSIGMLIDPGLVLERPLPLLILLLGLVIGKFGIVFITAILMRLPLRVAILSGSALAQVGEFSFVLMGAAKDTTLLSPTLSSDLTTAVIISMMFTPLMMAFSPHLAAGVGKIPLLTKLMHVTQVEDSAEAIKKLEGHVIIAGMGVAGQELSKALKELEIPYVMVDMNPTTIRREAAKGEPIWFGDITSEEVLEMLGAHRARELVLTINDPNAVLQAVKSVKRLFPDLPVIVRTRYLGDVPAFQAAGAEEIIPAELEAAIKVIDSLLKRHGVDPEKVARRLNLIRENYKT